MNKKTYNVYFDVVFTVEAESEEEAANMVKKPNVPGATWVQYAMTWGEDEEGMEEDESTTI